MLVGVCSCMCIGDWNNGCLSVCLSGFCSHSSNLLYCNWANHLGVLSQCFNDCAWEEPCCGIVKIFCQHVQDCDTQQRVRWTWCIDCQSCYLFSLRVANRALQFRTAFTWKPSNFGTQVEFLGVFSILSSMKFLNIMRWTREDYGVLCCWWRSVVIFMLWLFSSGI